MFLPFGERRKTNKEKFQSRKYRFVMFWNVLLVVSLILQFILAYLGKEAKIPLDIITGLTGLLNAEYLGINILEKKILGNPVLPATTEKK